MSSVYSKFSCTRVPRGWSPQDLEMGAGPSWSLIFRDRSCDPPALQRGLRLEIQHAHRDGMMPRDHQTNTSTYHLGGKEGPSQGAGSLPKSTQYPVCLVRVGIRARSHERTKASEVARENKFSGASRWLKSPALVSWARDASSPWHEMPHLAEKKRFAMLPFIRASHA